MAKTKKEKVADYLGKHPEAKIAAVVKACKVSAPTVSLVKSELGLTKTRGSKKKKKVAKKAKGKSTDGDMVARLKLASQLIAASGGVDQAERDLATMSELQS